MARQRHALAELARLFDAVDRPVYVLDDELAIRFLNKACQEWIGQDAAQLFGRRCKYHTPPLGTDLNPADAAAAGLCPPAVVLEGRTMVGTIATGSVDGGVRRRRARFVPAGPSGHVPSLVIAWVDPVDLEAGTERRTDEVVRESLEPTEPTPDDLHDRIRRFREEAAGRYRANRLSGDSPATQLARTRLELAAASRANVLVVGPVGSGRQHVAHAIHYGADPERSGTLIPVDCAVLGTELIRSTIRALAANPLGDRARQSTLLLIEANLMPAEVQRDVAEAIASKAFRYRVVATATSPLGPQAESGHYNSRLAALLSAIVVELPALAQRREDIPLLAQLFVEDINARGPKQLAGFSPEALDRLDAYPWPGNLDELAAVVAEAYGRAEGAEIAAGDIPSRLHRAAEAEAHPPRETESVQLDEFLARIERELLERAMAGAKGNKTKAAAMLGVTRPRLYRRLVQLGLEAEGE
jgi:DNA-binding NtrC family response regulator